MTVITLENPPGFVVRTEAQKATWDNGYRLKRGIEGGWLHYGSTTAPGSVWIAGASPRGPWLLSIDHSGVVAEIGKLVPLEIVATFCWTRDGPLPPTACSIVMSRLPTASALPTLSTE